MWLAGWSGEAKCADEGPDVVCVPSRSRAPLGRCIMDAMKEGPESTMSPGRVVALAAGLSIGAGVGYMVYRHLSSTGMSATCESSPLHPF